MYMYIYAEVENGYVCMYGDDMVKMRDTYSFGISVL